MYRKKSSTTILDAAKTSRRTSKNPTINTSGTLSKNTSVNSLKVSQQSKNMNQKLNGKQNTVNNTLKDKKSRARQINRENNQNKMDSTNFGIKKVKDSVTKMSDDKKIENIKENKMTLLNLGDERIKNNKSNVLNAQKLTTSGRLNSTPIIQDPIQGEQFNALHILSEIDCGSCLQGQFITMPAPKIMISMFRILRKTGQNMFSTSFEAIHIELGMLFNLKVFQKSKIIQQGLEDRVISEIKLRFKVNHPGIQQIYGFFDDQVYLYLIEEYHSDNQTSLQNRLAQNKKLSQKQCGSIFRQILDTIRYLHCQNYCHRDLQLTNLKDQFGIVKLVNFNWITEMNTSPYNRYRDTFCGSMKNAPPQVIKGGSYNSSVDIWGLGLILYELAIGIHPFQNKDKNVGNWYGNKGLSELNFPIFLSNQLVDLLGKLLECKQQRITLEQIYEHPWTSIWEVDGFVSKQIWNFWAVNHN